MTLLIMVALFFAIAVLIMAAARQADTADEQYEAYLVGDEAAHRLPDTDTRPLYRSER